MSKVGSMALSSYAAQLQREKHEFCLLINKEASKDNRRKLLLEYAEKCEALGHWYRQEGDKRRAKGDEINAEHCKNSAQGNFEQANKARQEAAQIEDVR